MGYYISDDDWPDFKEMLRLFRSSRGSGRTGQGGLPGKRQSDRLVMFLETLSDGGDALAIQLKRVEEGTPCQHIVVVGEPEGGTITLYDIHDDDETSEFPLDATADEVRDAIVRLPSFDIRDVVVTGGSVEVPNPVLAADTTVEMSPGRWFVTFQGRYNFHAQESAPGFAAMPILRASSSLSGIAEVQVRKHFLVDALKDPFTVRATLPLGLPSPIRPGSICSACWYDGIGWGVNAAEPRLFLNDEYEPPSYYYFD